MATQKQEEMIEASQKRCAYCGKGFISALDSAPLTMKRVAYGSQVHIYHPECHHHSLTWPPELGEA